MPFSALMGQWLNKFWYIQIARYYLVPKRNELPRHEKTWKKLNAHCWVKGPNQERLCMYHIVPTILHPGQQTMETVKQTVMPSIWVGGCTGRAQQSSGAVRLFCGAAQWWAHATALLFEPTERPPPGGNPQVNCGLGVVVICQCRSTVITHVALWCRFRSRGRLCTHVMVEDTWENS